MRAGREFLSIRGRPSSGAVRAAMQRPAVLYLVGAAGRAHRRLLADIAKFARRGAPTSTRQRPWRLGGATHQLLSRRRQGAGAGKRALRDRLGRGGAQLGARFRGAAGDFRRAVRAEAKQKKKKKKKKKKTQKKKKKKKTKKKKKKQKKKKKKKGEKSGSRRAQADTPKVRSRPLLVAQNRHRASGGRQ